MVECPSCGRQINREDTRPKGFQCPWCKEHLVRAFRGGRVAHLSILLLGCFLCYAAGARGGNVFLLGYVTYFFIGMLYHLFTSIYWPKFKKDTAIGDDFPHIVFPTDRSNKP
jgi:hypothetical protein